MATTVPFSCEGSMDSVEPDPEVSPMSSVIQVLEIIMHLHQTVVMTLGFLMESMEQLALLLFGRFCGSNSGVHGMYFRTQLRHSPRHGLLNVSRHVL